MIKEIIKEADERMGKAIAALSSAFNKIRTGRAHPSILDGVHISYYGADTPLNQVANISIEDGRTLAITPWERQLTPEIEKAIMKSDLGLNPVSAGHIIRVPMPALTEETRKGYIRQARLEAENARVSVRNARRDANSMVKELMKAGDVTEDEEHRAEDDIQKLTDKYVAEIDQLLKNKEADLLEI